MATVGGGEMCALYKHALGTRRVHGPSQKGCCVLIDTPEARDVGNLKKISPQHPVTLLRDALQDPEHWLAHHREGAPMFDCSFYKAVIMAIQDVVTVDMVVKRARELGVGSSIYMGE
jgi:hypothetical protein